MHAGCDNYWMYNRQDTLLNLSKSNFSQSVSLDSYKQVQDGRHTAMPNRFVPSRNNITAKNQNPMTDQQRMPPYSWTSPVYAPSRPNYQKGPGMQQKDPRLYWQQSGYLRNNVPQRVNNDMSQKNQALESNNNGAVQTPRIRVRDVHSLNNIARNSMLSTAMHQRQFNRYPNCPYNVNEGQQNIPQKGNTEHANFIPSLLEVNPFQPNLQRPTTAPIQPLCQEQYVDTRRTSYSQGNQYQMNNTRRNEAYGNSATLLEELLTFTTSQLDNLQAAEAAQNAQTANNNMSVSHKDNEISLLRLLEDSCSYRNPPPSYTEVVQTTNVPLTTGGSSLPIIEPITPPPVESDTTPPTSQPLRVTAVISLPDLNNVNFNKSISTEILVPTPISPAESRHSEHDTPAVTVPVSPANDCLKVKEEPLSNSNDIEIVTQPIKTENIQEQDENVQKTDNKEQKTCRDENANLEICKNSDQIQTEKPVGKESSTENNETTINDVKSTSYYKSEINRDKLDMLIKFLHREEKDKEEIHPEKSNAKKYKKVECVNKQKLKSSSVKSTNGKTEPVPDKAAEGEVMKCSPSPSPNENECSKKVQNKSKEQSSKQTEESLEKKPKNDSAKQSSDCKNDQEKRKFKDEKSKPKKKKTVSKTDGQTEKTKESSDCEKCKTPERKSGKTPADVTEGNSQDKIWSLPSLEENENPKDAQKDEEEKTELITSPKPPEKPFQDTLQERETDGTARRNPGRIFPNFNYHFCGNCNLVSPIEWFWINAVTGELKCLNCFKRMNLDSIETNYKLPFSDGKDPEGNKDIPNSPKMKNTTTGDVDKQTNQKVGEKTNKTESDNRSKEEPPKEKRKSLDDDLSHDRKEKRRKSDEETQSSKTDKADRKSLSKDGSESPKGERPRKNSTDQIKRSQSREEESTLKVRREGEATKKRKISKEESACKKFRVAEETGEDFAEKFVTEKLKKMKEGVQKIKLIELEELERKRKSSREEDFPEKETKNGEKQLKPKENCHKILRELFEDGTKPLKEKQNTKNQNQRFEKLIEKRKKLEKNVKVNLKDSGERKKLEGERKNGGIKGPLQYKDFVLNKSAESYFPEVMEGFSLKKMIKDADATKKNLKCNGKNDERCSNLFAKLKKKTKTLSLNLLKET